MRSTLTLVTVMVIAAPLVAQNVPPLRDVQTASYEAASVKPHDNTAAVAYASVLRSRPGEYHVVNITAAGLLQFTFRVRPYQLAGAPDWMLKDKWEVEIKAPGSSMRDQAGQILKVLEDRFKLRVHKETRELPIHTLTRTRPDALGYAITPPKSCPDGSMSGALANWWIKCGDWRFVVDYIGSYLDRPLDDRTGITGQYDVKLEWTPPALGTGPDSVPIAGDNISIFTAIRDQLGVKLDSGRGPVEMLVIDHIEPPDPN